MKSFYAFFIFLTLIAKSVYPQENYASNIATTISEGKKLFINYDIVVHDDAKYFNVELSVAYEGQQIALDPKNLFGDFGHGITPGNKIIYWNYGGEFDKDISKVEVKVYAYRENEPQARFKSVAISGDYYAPCEVKFNNSSTDSYKYEWDFGDPDSGEDNFSFEKNPTHRYKSKGRYTVALVAYNTYLNLKSAFYETIIIKEHEPTTANFEITGFENLINQRTPLTVSFKNKSVNADSYAWNFGDPGSGKKNSSTEANPDHRYKKPGDYRVELKAANLKSGFSSAKTIDFVLPGKAAKPVEADVTTDHKHKKLKTIWMAAGIASLGTGVYAYTQSNRLYDEYKTATDEASDLRQKIKTYDTITPVALGVSALSAVQVYIHLKKQSGPTRQIAITAAPAGSGGALVIRYQF